MNFLTRITRLIGCKGPNLSFSSWSATQKFSNVPPPLLQVTSLSNSWIWQQNHSKEIPLVYNIKIDLPNSAKWIIPLSEQLSNITEIEAPPVHNQDTPKQAARLIIIRRKKMKKHKLKKLRKKMKFEWAKLRQRRELKKEKTFQAVLIEQYKAAEQFSAEKYVAERIEKLNELVIPRVWKGKRLPEFIIREKMGLPPKSKK